MAFEINLAPDSVRAMKNLVAPVRTGVKEAIERHLTHEPTKVSKARIKRLRGLSQPQYRLRVDEVRVFYDITEEKVEVLAIVPKSEAEAWLAEAGKPEEEVDEESGSV